MSAGAGRSIHNRAMLLLLLLVEYVAWPRRRGTCTDRKFRRQLFGSVEDSTADESRAACNCHPTTSSVEEGNTADVQSRAWWKANFESVEDSTAGESRATSSCQCHVTTSSVEDSTADNSRAAYNCHLETKERPVVNFGSSLCATNQSRESFNGHRYKFTNGRLKLLEESAENFARTFPCTQDQTATNPGRAIDNGQTTILEGSTDNFNIVENYTSLCAEEHTANLSQPTARNSHLDVWEGSVCCLHWLVSTIYQQLCLHCREEFSVRHDDLHGWSQRSWWDGIAGWLEYCAGELSGQHGGSYDRSQQSCLDSIDEICGQHGNLCLDQNIVFSDTDSDMYSSDTLHGTVTSETIMVDFLLHRSADDNTIATTSRQLGNSGDDMDSSATEQLLVRQPDRNNDDMDICEDMISSTTEQLLVRQPDSNDDMDVSMAREQPIHGNDYTRSVSWWWIPGFRFLPTDQEIVLHYLKHKVLNLGLPTYHPVCEGVNVYVLDAYDITLDVNNRDEELLGFFFVRKEQKHTYTNGCFYTTPDGYWKVRGRPARVKHGGRTIAFKTSMDYYRGRPPHGCRTPWSMFEYALNAGRHQDLRNLQHPWMDSYVVCKVRKRERAPARVKKLSGLLRRRFRLKKMVQKDGAMEPKATAPRRAAGVPGILGKRKHDDLF